MAFTFEFPVHLPRYTTEEFQTLHHRYIAEHGYTIHVPGFEDVIRWGVPNEPTLQETALRYREREIRQSRDYYIRKLGAYWWDYLGYQGEPTRQQLLTIGETRFEEMRSYEDPADPAIDLYEYETYLSCLSREDRANRMGQLISERRRAEIDQIIADKRERFLRMLQSPKPNIANNAASILTFLDDMNDSLGTFACMARILAKKMPGIFARNIATGLTGWLLTAAEIIGLAQQMSMLPISPMRLQHAYHAGLKDHPLSKRGRVRRLRKMARLRLSKGEIIEGLQTTDNVFGVGLCLGGIFSLLWDIPSGIYRHVRGEEVRVQNLPSPLLQFDRAWSRFLKSAAQMWTGIPEISDKELGQSMVSMNMCSNMLSRIFYEFSPLDYLPDLDGVLMPAPTPLLPTTTLAIMLEGKEPRDYVGWPSHDAQYISPTDPWNDSRTQIIDNLKAWWQRNSRDTEAMVCSQNAVESSLTNIAMLETKENVEWNFDQHTQSFLTLLNNGYRWPPDATKEQADCFAKMVRSYDQVDYSPSATELTNRALIDCNFEFTLRVPDQPELTTEQQEEQRQKSIRRLRVWYFYTWFDLIMREWRACRCPSGWYSQGSLNSYTQKTEWLRDYGFPPNQPAKAVAMFGPGGFRDLKWCIPDIEKRLFALYDPFPELKKQFLKPYIDHLLKVISGSQRWYVINKPEMFWTLDALYWERTNCYALEKARNKYMYQYFKDNPPTDYERHNWALIHQTPLVDWPHMYYFLYRTSKYYTGPPPKRPKF